LDVVAAENTTGGLGAAEHTEEGSGAAENTAVGFDVGDAAVSSVSVSVCAAVAAAPVEGKEVEAAALPTPGKDRESGGMGAFLRCVLATVGLNPSPGVNDGGVNSRGTRLDSGSSVSSGGVNSRGVKSPESSDAFFYGGGPGVESGGAGVKSEGAGVNSDHVLVVSALQSRLEAMTNERDVAVAALANALQQVDTLLQAAVKAQHSPPTVSQQVEALQLQQTGQEQMVQVLTAVSSTEASRQGTPAVSPPRRGPPAVSYPAKHAGFGLPDGADSGLGPNGSISGPEAAPGSIPGPATPPHSISGPGTPARPISGARAAAPFPRSPTGPGSLAGRNLVRESN